MSTFIKLLIGTATLAAAVTATAAADGASSPRLQSNFGELPVKEAIDQHTGVATLSQSGFGYGPARLGNTVQLGEQNRYVDALGFYLEGMAERVDAPHPRRTDSPFALNDIQHQGNANPVKYVTVIDEKSQLNANFNIDRSTREGWGINGKVVGTLPEPGTLLLVGLGLLGLGLARRRAASPPA